MIFAEKIAGGIGIHLQVIIRSYPGKRKKEEASNDNNEKSLYPLFTKHNCLIHSYTD
jgi:hypothetical protein